MAEPQFTPQPYPLYALTLNKLDDPARFEPTDPPVRLVVGWTPDPDRTLPWPVLAHNGLTVWDGIASFHADRAEAEKMGKEFARLSRSEIRSQYIGDWFAALEAKLKP